MVGPLAGGPNVRWARLVDLGEERQRRHLGRRVDDFSRNTLGVHLFQPAADVERAKISARAGSVAGVKDRQHAGLRAGRQGERVEVLDILAYELEELRLVAVLEVLTVDL